MSSLASESSSKPALDTRAWADAFTPLSHLCRHCGLTVPLPPFCFPASESLSNPAVDTGAQAQAWISSFSSTNVFSSGEFYMLLAAQSMAVGTVMVR